MGKLDKLEKDLVTLAKQAAKGDAKAEARVAAEIAALAKGSRGDGWPTRGSVAFTVFDALVEASGRRPAALRRLAGAFLDAIVAQPESLGLPYQFRPAGRLRDPGMPLLARAFDRAIAKTSRGTIEGFGRGSPMNSPGFSVAMRALYALFQYHGSGEKVAAALLAI